MPRPPGGLLPLTMTGENFGTICLGVQKLSNKSDQTIRHSWEERPTGMFFLYNITERSVRWYYGFSIAIAAAARRPWRREHSNSKNIQPISFKFYMRVDTPLRYFAIEIWYPPMTTTTAFTAKRHLYPPDLQNAISPLLMVRLLSNFIQR